MVESAGTFADDPPVSSEARRRWRKQIGDARAGKRCECGQCPSIEIEIGDGRTPTGGDRVVLEASNPSASLLLFIDGGRLSYLELAPHGDERFDEFPPSHAITV